MTPKYLLNQLDCSLRNLDVETIDIYYLHNPETQLGKMSTRGIRQPASSKHSKRWKAPSMPVKFACTALRPGTAFATHTDAKDYLSLTRVIELAEKAGGKNHHFKVIQLPLNLGMSEALSNANQPAHGHRHNVLEAAQDLGITVMCSASVLQGQLSQICRRSFARLSPGLETDGQRALQFVRSTPGVTTALVGMKQQKHVEENLQTARLAAGTLGAVLEAVPDER